MPIRPAVRLYVRTALAVALLSIAVPASAQFQPQPVSDPTPVPGERYHIEAAFGFWRPTAEMSISSSQFEIVGTTIDFKRDLGLVDGRFPELHLVGRPGRKHKFRLQYIPIKYEQAATLERTIVFNGQSYFIGLPVTSSLDWKAWRFGYEYDFIARQRGFAGFVLDIKYTDVGATLTSPLVSEYAVARAPIPAIGGIFRVYPVSSVSITGEITGFKLPENVVEDSTGHYFDVDFYGRFDFNRYVAVQVGYRSFDVGYVVERDLGDFRLKGIYFGFVARY
jgi:hypothetical protein